MAALFLASCGSNDTALEEVLDDKDSFDAAVNSFADGNAKDAEEYFAGLLAEVIEVDVKFHETERLDEMNATPEEINAVLDSCIKLIHEAEVALELYKDKDWARRGDFHDLTIEWFGVVEEIVTDYLRPLAVAMSKPDEDLTDDDLDLYEELDYATEDYIEVDTRWVAFQHTFAAANGFQLGTNTVDVEALIEEELASE